MKLKLSDLKISKELKDWLEKRYPKKCKCGTVITEHRLYIDEVAVCEECFHEATKHIVFN